MEREEAEIWYLDLTKEIYLLAFVWKLIVEPAVVLASVWNHRSQQCCRQVFRNKKVYTKILCTVRVCSKGEILCTSAQAVSKVKVGSRNQNNKVTDEIGRLMEQIKVEDFYIP